MRAVGPASVQKAWERYAVPALWPTWSPHLRAVDYPHPRLVAGTDGVVRGPLGVRAGFNIDDVDEARHRWSWTVRTGPLTLRLGHGVDEMAEPSPDHRRSTTWLEISGPLLVLLAYAPVARFALGRLVR